MTYTAPRTTSPPLTPEEIATSKLIAGRRFLLSQLAASTWWAPPSRLPTHGHRWCEAGRRQEKKRKGGFLKTTTTQQQQLEHPIAGNEKKLKPQPLRATVRRPTGYLERNFEIFRRLFGGKYLLLSFWRENP
jgi:hypothetical protein